MLFDGVVNHLDDHQVTDASGKASNAPPRGNTTERSRLKHEPVSSF